jgi:4-hydroxy-tetrahydrodipicolinate synthase
MLAEALAGTFTALVTPFTPDGESVDWEALDALVRRQLEGGVQGLVPCGTTGESPTLSEEEQLEVIRRVAGLARGKALVFAGTGSFSTKKTIEASKAALGAGAEGVMIVMPYYNKPSQQGLVEHTLSVARSVEAPIILYNIPGRSVVDLGVEATLSICRQAPNVIGLKDATGHVLRCQELVHRLGDRLSVLCGDDALTLPMMAVGARGVISVTSNLLPAEVEEVTRLALQGDFVGARRAHQALLELHASLFVEPNPCPAKAALGARGLMSPAVRPPLLRASEATTLAVLAALAPFDPPSSEASPTGAKVGSP